MYLSVEIGNIIVVNILKAVKKIFYDVTQLPLSGPRSSPGNYHFHPIFNNYQFKLLII